MRFSYAARKLSGESVAGIQEAADSNSLAAVLRAEGLVPQMVHAFVVVGKDDVVPEAKAAGAGAGATDGFVQRTVEFVFPPGYEDVRLDGDPPTVKFMVVEITGPAPPGGPGKPTSPP